jgi:hypothetical protein
MVRFSDMLGGGGEPDDAHAATSPYAALSDDEPEDDEPEADHPDDEPEAEPEPSTETNTGS